MTRYLLDTNVVSEVRRPRPDPGVLRWLEAARGDDLYLSVLTIGEIRLGIVRLERRDPARAEALEAWLAGLEQGYAERILPVTAAVVRRWAALSAERPLPVVDALLAATAAEQDATLVTRNVADLAGVDVPLLNPFGAGD